MKWPSGPHHMRSAEIIGRSLPVTYGSRRDRGERGEHARKDPDVRNDREPPAGCTEAFRRPALCPAVGGRRTVFSTSSPSFASSASSARDHRRLSFSPSPHSDLPVHNIHMTAQPARLGLDTYS